MRLRLCAVLLLLTALAVAAPAAAPLHLEKICLPPGFRIELWARVPGARSMTLSPSGILYVGTRGEGKVYAVVDRGARREVVTIARGLDMPNGVAFREGALYVAEVSRILRFDGIDKRLRRPPKPVVVFDRLPDKRAHGWKFIRFGPDGRLYVPIGAPCNICDPGDPFAAITRMNPDGSGFEIFARGIRNTVGFDWSPATKELWFTDNGRDWMGDNEPPDELNRAPRAGMHFGYPYRHGRIPDAEFGKKGEELKMTDPELELEAHVAALGMRFYDGTMFPRQYRGRIFIAEHGSWNRSVPIGYRVVSVRMEGNRPAAAEVFAEGWHGALGAWGRPVDVQPLPDGSLLISDDTGDAIYRITWSRK